MMVLRVPTQEELSLELAKKRTMSATIGGKMKKLMDPFAQERKTTLDFAKGNPIMSAKLEESPFLSSPPKRSVDRSLRKLFWKFTRH